VFREFPCDPCPKLLPPAAEGRQKEQHFGRLACPTRMTRRLEPLIQDLRYAVRGLRRSPAFTITVVLTLALGIGANTAIFGIIDRLMFRPYPYMRDAGTVHRVYLKSTDRGTTNTGGVSIYTRYLDLKKFTSSFSHAAAMTSQSLAVGVGEGARERPVGVVSASFFEFFDAAPALGRLFTAAEDTTPRGAEVAVLSYAFWQNEFAGKDVRGQVLQISNIPCVIIGVLPKGFAGVWDGNPPVAYIPITTFAGSNSSRSDAETYYTRYNWGWMDMMVRRRPDVSVDGASADLTNAFVKSWEIMLATQSVAPAAIARPTAIAGPLKVAAGPDPSIEAKTVRWVGGIAIIVLLIACSNVANLFLSRALKRRRETAVRIALGVARHRLIRQWFTESVLLAFVGCAAGVLIAQWGGASLRALFVGTGAAIPVATDWRTLGVAAALAIIAAILAGTAPSFVLGRDGVAAALKAGAREGTHRRSRLRTSLLVVQVTLSVVLLVGAGLFVRSFSHVRSLRLGYDIDPNVLVGRNLRGQQLTDSQIVTLNRELLARVKTLPMVEHAALASSIPFYSTSSTGFRVTGIDSIQRLGRFTYQSATEDYFAAMDTRILRGRAFTAADRGGSEPVTVVSEAMAKVLWPSVEALGQCIYISTPDAPCTRVIGIAENTAQNQLEGNDRFRYYLPLEQFRPQRGNYVIVRVRGDVNVAGEALRKALQTLMPGQGYVTTRPMRSLIESQQRAWRFGSTMFLAYGILALVVASIGLYGVIGYNVAQRMHELGVRIALGARTRHVISLVMSQGMIVAIAGIVLGSGIALAVSAKVQPLLFQQSARDPMVYAIVAGTLVIAALAACFVPARRAAKADPNLSLRSD
jgi:putative ABC transport system permease protein